MRQRISILLIVVLAVLPVFYLFGQDIQPVEWICTTDTDPWVRKDIRDLKIGSERFQVELQEKSLHTIRVKI